MGNSHVSPMWLGLQYTAPMENIYFYLLGITCKPHSSRNTKNQPCGNELEIHTSYVNAVFPNTLATYIYHRKAIFPPYVDELATHTLSKKVVWIDMWHTLPILIYIYIFQVDVDTSFDTHILRNVVFPCGIPGSHSQCKFFLCAHGIYVTCIYLKQ